MVLWCQELVTGTLTNLFFLEQHQGCYELKGEHKIDRECAPLLPTSACYTEAKKGEDERPCISPSSYI